MIPNIGILYIFDSDFDPLTHVIRFNPRLKGLAFALDVRHVPF